MRRFTRLQKQADKWRILARAGEGHVHSYINNKEEYKNRLMEFYDKCLK